MTSWKAEPAGRARLLGGDYFCSGRKGVTGTFEDPAREPQLERGAAEMQTIYPSLCQSPRALQL